jgi:hypothetical protein
MKRSCNCKGRFFFILIIPALIALLSGIVMLLWNNVLVDVVKVSSISYWQAVGILILSKILFGFPRRGPVPPMFWMRKMQRKMEKMTPEEREKFKEQMQQRFAQWGMPNNSCNG